MPTYPWDNISALPLVLCGPILRRVEKDSVTVWVALKEEKSLFLEIFETTGSKEVVANGFTDTIKFGKNLHIACVTAIPLSGNLTQGKIYAYDITFSGSEKLAGKDIVCSDSGKFKSEFCYGSYDLPSFCLPSEYVDNTKLEHLKIAHGSCRKPHGGKRDAFRLLDGKLSDYHKVIDPKERIQMLFLTGDQIYADDVDPYLFEMLEKVTDSIVNIPEILPIENDSSIYNDGFSQSELEKNNRYQLIKKIGFTADENESQNHVIKLGEFYSMYLFAWSDVLWPDLDAEAHENSIEIQNYWRALPKVRKVLANIPTYMIFDDHEITDDWFRTFEWSEKTLSDPTARRVLANGLSAYAVFQGWGNIPEKFDNTLLPYIDILENLKINSSPKPNFSTLESLLLP
ncbi:MAG: hypothetical protein KDC88_15985, partial [Ignavibacteriae bacterium]|nr:hypothetical protein [Ignavibacteriota bacterium]